MAEKSFALDAVIKEAVYLLGFLLLTVFWKFDFPPFMVLVIAILNNGTIMTISKDKVQPSPHPDSWKLSEIFATGIVLGGYLALMTVLFFWASYETNFFPNRLGVENFNRHNLYMSDDLNKRMASAVYLQVSTISQALIFVTRCGRWSYAERPGFLLVIAFVITQLIASVISATATSKFSGIRKISWGWTGVIWLFNIATFSLLDPLQVAVRYARTGRFWRLVVDEGVPTGVSQALEIVQSNIQ